MTGLLATLIYLPALFLSVETEISWSANSESDLAGYKIYYGKASRNYDQVIDVGKQPGYSITLTETNVTYYFAVTAYDSSGNESAFSEEVEAIIEGQVDPDPDPDPDPQPDPTGIDEKVYNFPNPFIAGQQETHIRYSLQEASPVTIEIFNVNNELVRTLENETEKSAGTHTETIWNGQTESGENVPHGIYYGRIMTANKIRIIKIAVLR
ncbi:MAG: hypothetical protein DWQ05_02460 [Calditrichaeota bacterium]|nr:MAG: hypothetical protein DWQ05_02460 [Calditrichota bacterium]